MDPYFHDQETKVFKHNLAVVLKQGESFGELAIMRLVPRAGSAICRDDCIFGVLDSLSYKKILNAEHQMKIEKKMNFFRDNLLFGLEYNDQVKISYFFEKKKKCMGEVLFTEGEPLKKVILIANGNVEIRKKVKLDIFELEYDENISIVEKGIIKAFVKDKFGIENDIRWDHKILIGGSSMIIGAYEVYNFFEQQRPFLKAPKNFNIMSEVSVKVSSNNLMYYTCDIEPFQKILETYPNFLRHITPYLLSNQKHFHDKINQVKILKRKFILDNHGLTKNKMMMEYREFDNKKYFSKKNLGKKNQAKWNVHSNRCQLKNGMLIDKLIKIKERMLNIKKRSSTIEPKRKKKEEENSFDSDSFLTTKSIRLKRSRKKKGNRIAEIIAKDRNYEDSQLKNTKKDSRYSKIRKSLIKLKNIQNLNSPSKIKKSRIKNLGKIANLKLMRKCFSKSKSRLKNANNEMRKICLLKKSKRRQMIAKRKSLDIKMRAYNQSFRISSRTNSFRRRTSHQSSSLEDVKIHNFGDCFNSSSIYKTVISIGDKETIDKKKSKTIFSGFKYNQNKKLSKNNLFSHTKDTVGSLKTKFNADVLHKKRQRKDTWKRDSPFINHLVDKSKRRNRMKSSFNSKKSEVELIERRSLSLDKELELPIVANSCGMVKLRNDHGPNFYFKRIYEDRLELTSNNMKKLRNNLYKNLKVDMRRSCYNV